MKKVWLITLIFSLLSASFYGQDDMRNYSPGQLTNMEYEAGRRVISEIVLDNELRQVLDGFAYAGCFLGGAWLLIKRGMEFYECYSGKRGGKCEKYVTYDLSTKELNSLFEWSNYQESFSYNIRSTDMYYQPFYYYFILYDCNHNRKLEFNSSTMSTYQNAQKTKKTRKKLPFTKEQQKLIWELFGFF